MAVSVAVVSRIEGSIMPGEMYCVRDPGSTSYAEIFLVGDVVVVVAVDRLGVLSSSDWEEPRWKGDQSRHGIVREMLVSVHALEWSKKCGDQIYK